MFSFLYLCVLYVYSAHIPINCIEAHYKREAGSCLLEELPTLVYAMMWSNLTVAGASISIAVLRLVLILYITLRATYVRLLLDASQCT